MTRILFAIMLAVILSAASQAATRHVIIDDYAFAPAKLTVHPGDTVIWTNKDNVAHTVTALKGAFDSGALDAGKTYRYVFSKIGSYAYRCSIHPEMRGTIMVEPAH